MGQAKQRGTREQRVAQAVERKKIEMGKRYSAHMARQINMKRAMQGNPAIIAAVAYALSASIRPL